MTEISDTYRPRPRSGLAERIIDGEALLVNAEGGEILVLNECGAFLWQRLDGERTVAQLVEATCEEYEVDEPQARRDVQAFLEALRARGALLD
jgi:hypothetical protein